LRHLSLPYKQWFLRKTFFANEKSKLINADMIYEENYLGETDTLIHNQKRYNLTRMSFVLAYGVYVTVD
jgi:hypothetical protein